jgi:hypothetical protein
MDIRTRVKELMDSGLGVIDAKRVAKRDRIKELLISAEYASSPSDAIKDILHILRLMDR